MTTSGGSTRISKKSSPSPAGNRATPEAQHDATGTGRACRYFAASDCAPGVRELQESITLIHPKDRAGTECGAGSPYSQSGDPKSLNQILPWQSNREQHNSSLASTIPRPFSVQRVCLLRMLFA